MDMLSGLIEKAAARPNLQRLGRNCSTEFVLQTDDTPHHVVIQAGRVIEILEGPFQMRPHSFSIQASAAAWAEFCQPMPAPGYNDIFAMTSNGHARLTGDSAVLLAHLRFFKDLLACMREDA